jgi:hypothetical protein
MYVTKKRRGGRIFSPFFPPLSLALALSPAKKKKKKAERERS